MDHLEATKLNKFSLHNISLQVMGTGAQEIAQDFDFYLHRPSAPHTMKFQIELQLVSETPNPEHLPEQAADQVFSECVLYRQGDLLVYDYHGKAELRVERNGAFTRGQLTCADPHLRHELGYLFLQSELGRALDAQGLHRVHALGLGLASGKGALVLLPSGGGKSSLALGLLAQEGCTLLSDDTPLVDRLGRLHPLLLRFAFRADAKLPPALKDKATLFERRKFGAKLLVPCSALPAERLPRPGDVFSPGYLVLGVRHGSRKEPRLVKASKWRGLPILLRDLVVGYGVPQVLELLLSKGWKSLPGFVPAAASRMLAASAFLARSKMLVMEFSSDPARNAEFLMSELSKMEERS